VGWGGGGARKQVLAVARGQSDLGIACSVRHTSAKKPCRRPSSFWNLSEHLSEKLQETMPPRARTVLSPTLPPPDPFNARKRFFPRFIRGARLQKFAERQTAEHSRHPAYGNFVLNFHPKRRCPAPEGTFTISQTLRADLGGWKSATFTFRPITSLTVRPEWRAT
jgi:hypothetical protein